MKHYAALIACITGAALAAAEKQWIVLIVMICVGVSQVPGLVREVRAMNAQQQEEDEDK